MYIDMYTWALVSIEPVLVRRYHGASYSQLARGKDGILVVIMQTFGGVGLFCKDT